MSPSPNIFADLCQVLHGGGVEDGALGREAARLDVASLLQGEAVAAVSDDDFSSVQALQQVLETRHAGVGDGLRMFGMDREYISSLSAH